MHWNIYRYFSGVRFTRSLVFSVVYCRSLFVLLFFFICPLCCLFFSFAHCAVCSSHLAIMLSVLLRYTDYDCPSGIFKLFFNRNYKQRFLITLLIPSYIIFVRVVFLMHYFCKSCLSYAFLRKQRLFGQIEKSKYN